MAALFVCVIFSLSLGVHSLEADKPGDLDHQFSCDDSEDYWIYWKHDDTSITIELHAMTTGWIGFGIAPKRVMSGSDIIMAGFDQKAYAEDMKGTGHEAPIADMQQDVEIISGSEDNGVTRVRIKRPLVSSDHEDDLNIECGIVHIICAYGSADSLSQYHHGNNWPRSVQLRFCPPVLTEDYGTNHKKYRSCDIYWKTEGTSVTFEMICKTTGYIGIGISPDGQMKDSDIVVVYTMGTNPIHEDRYGVGHDEPIKDQFNDWMLHKAKHQDGYFQIKVSRSITAVESTVDRDIRCGMVDIISAFGPKPTSPNNTTISYHGEVNRHNFKIELFKCPLMPTVNYHGNHRRFGKCDFYYMKMNHNVTFEVICKHTGYIGIGISADGNMKNSDIVTGYIIGDQTIHQDRFASANSQPHIDPDNNWELLDLSEKDGYTRMKVTRLLKAAEPDFDRDINCGMVNVIWAIGSKPTVDSNTNIEQHSNTSRGHFHVVLYKCEDGGHNNYTHRADHRPPGHTHSDEHGEHSDEHGEQSDEHGEQSDEYGEHSDEHDDHDHDLDCVMNDCPCEIIERYTLEATVKTNDGTMQIPLQQCRDTSCINPRNKCDSTDEDKECMDEMLMGWCSGFVSSDDKPTFMNLTFTNPRMFRMNSNGEPEIKLMRHFCLCEEPKAKGRPPCPDGHDHK